MLDWVEPACHGERVELSALLADLDAEGDDVDAMVATLPDDRWATPTPAERWTVAHQVAHLAWTDLAARQAATDVDAFRRGVAEAGDDPMGFVDRAADEGAALPHAELLDKWRAGRKELVAVLAAVPQGAKLPWFGPPMSAASMATARLMETWAHGQDIADALGITRTPTARLRHVAHIGVRTRDFAHIINGRRPPAEQFRVELSAPDGALWTWGPEDAAQKVTGPALDFCLLATQRAHRADTALVAEGPDADAWLGIAQAFAGPPGGGRAKGSR
jgi:uncharacterized protein (TIGR03084 family)